MKTYRINDTHYPDAKSYYQNLIKYYLNFIFPYYSKSLPWFSTSSDNKIAVEKIVYVFGWQWKKWYFNKLTGRIFKYKNKLPSPEAAQDLFAFTGKDVYKELVPSENVIIYDAESFMPNEFEPYMTIKLFK